MIRKIAALIARPATVAVEVAPVVAERVGYYLASETYPAVRMYVGTHKGAAAVRLINMQANRPFDRYVLVEVA